MAKLFLKGINKPLTITKEEAQKVLVVQRDTNRPKETEIDLKGIRFTKGDIRYAVEHDNDDDEANFKDDKKQLDSEHVERMNREYENDLRARCRQSPDVKARSLNLFHNMYFSAYGEMPSDEINAKVIAMQLEYFKKYPKHPYANINYLKFIKEFPVQSLRFNFKPNITSFGIRFNIRLLEEAINTSRRLGIV